MTGRANPLGVRIEPLGKHHDRSSFSCGEQDLDDWFRNRASQDERRNVARVFVAIDRELGVVGFYTLSAFTLTPDEIPADIARKLPRYSAIPAVLIGRLARDEKARGQGIGELLVIDAINRALDAARSIAIFAIVVEAKNDTAVHFYETLGFRRFPATQRRLFLPASEAAAGRQKS